MAHTRCGGTATHQGITVYSVWIPNVHSAAVAQAAEHETFHINALVGATLRSLARATRVRQRALYAVAEGAAYFALRRNRAERSLQNLPHPSAVSLAEVPKR